MSIPTLTEQLDALYATTLAMSKGEVVDQVFLATPLWAHLKRTKAIKPSLEGRRIEVRLRYGKNETVAYFTKGDTVPINQNETLTVAYFNYKNCAATIVRYFEDWRKNRGKAQIINKVKDDIQTATSSLIDRFEQDLFGDGTGDNGKAIEGLAKHVADDPTSGVVGGIDRSTYTWWRNNYKDMSSENPSLYLRKRMREMFNSCGRYGEGVSRFPDFFVCSEGVYNLYEEETLEFKQIVNQNTGDASFGDLTFKGRPLRWSPSCPTGRIYFLNSHFFQFLYDPDFFFEMTEWKPIPNQPFDRVAQIVVSGNLTISNARRLGIIFGISES